MYWSRALFALKPIKLFGDKKHLGAQSFWQPQYNHSQVAVLHTPTSSEGLDQGTSRVKLFNCETDEKMCSGQIISLEADDLETRPLPSFELLDMQWVLRRLIAMSGAPGYGDDFNHNDDDDARAYGR
ncbi:hypothetical protein K432DRAFT_410603 [Lepidopterella palustris CBS 459.81]|uniref:Uncharacterized protein n=1 Tax=Lepidopterella palustris CBS 459.81 TaxID=1314670 RepID=A0A8E2DXQ5_9PEZI|nr:hypothetical protein K432DRAFT_410603 [Lepidopterella palustris CBS 459.81]